MTKLDSNSIINTKTTSTEYDSNFIVSPTVTTTYRVEAYNDASKYKTCVVKVPNISGINLKYSTTSSESLITISSNTSISVHTGTTLYLGYSVSGDGTVDLPTNYQTATWSDNQSTSNYRTITLSVDGTYTYQLTSTYKNTIVSFTLTVIATTPSAIVDSITIDNSDVTINAGESVTINSVVSGQYLTGGINVYYE